MWYYSLVSCTVFYLSSYSFRLSSLFDQWFRNLIYLYTWSAQLEDVYQLMPCFLSLRSALLDLIRHTAFQCFYILTLGGLHLSPVFFFYFITAAWNEIYAILGHVVSSWGLDSEEIFSGSHATIAYCPDIIWNTCLLNLFGQTFVIGQGDSREFSGIVLCSTYNDIII